MSEQALRKSAAPRTTEHPSAPGTSPTALAGRTVALVHEWFGATGGSEQVFRHIADLVPHGERFVLWKDRDATEPGLRESWLARTPLRHSKAVALPMMPLVWRTLSRQRFDVVISSSHAFAHTVKLGPPEVTTHLSYVHAPARYIWSPAFDGRGSSPLLNVPRRVLQGLDVRLSDHVRGYAANSQEVRARIRRYWGRDAVVINPPVDVDWFAAAPAADRTQARDYLLGVGRWIPYKNFDLIVAIADAAGLPLVLAGSGPEEQQLRRLAERAGVPVTLEVRPDRERLRQLYWGARALLFPVHEDFGMIPVEAQACGTPVVGLRRGGLLETVVEGETGFLVDSTDPADHVPLLRRLGELSAARIAAHAAGFSPARFAAEMTAWIDDECR
ncbi:glycosyltransferase [Micromonospora coxensis]|uniref:Glycosyltransferase involved in cell wall bisynthesis n=1 Tax=Micromonospora coxensis TaxID=356852 RepID=A0A1C5JF25_9ACTN|nr:glycosyltransferase [Micromonospora coxensis]SCG68616.1 Glycosyltransferase involved in cell wall bisynthesis [Micromonospora coxensis]